MDAHSIPSLSRDAVGCLARSDTTPESDWRGTVARLQRRELNELPAPASEESQADDSVSETTPLENLVEAPQPRLIHAARQQVAEGTMAGPVCLVHHRLLLVTKGQIEGQFGTETTTLRTGEAVLLPAGAQWRESVLCEAVERIVVDFSSALLCDEPRVTRDCAGRLRELSEWLIAEKHSVQAGAERYRSLTLNLLVAELERLGVDSAGVLEKRIQTYVIEHMAERITLEDLATHAGMSRYYFCRLYRKLTGDSAMEHVRGLRLQRARELIRATNLPLKDIAARVGLGSEHHLSRLLRARYGVGVRELRLLSR